MSKYSAWRLNSPAVGLFQDVFPFRQKPGP